MFRRRQGCSGPKRHSQTRAPTIHSKARILSGKRQFFSYHFYQLSFIFIFHKRPSVECASFTVVQQLVMFTIDNAWAWLCNRLCFSNRCSLSKDVLVGARCWHCFHAMVYKGVFILSHFSKDCKLGKGYLHCQNDTTRFELQL